MNIKFSPKLNEAVLEKKFQKRAATPKHCTIFFFFRISLNPHDFMIYARYLLFTEFKLTPLIYMYLKEKFQLQE